MGRAQIGASAPCIVVGGDDNALGDPLDPRRWDQALAGSSAWGYQPDLDPVPGLYVNYAGTVDEAWPERTRVSSSGQPAED